MSTVFISGPMTGHPNLNRDAFFDAEHVLTWYGYIVWNPAYNPDGLEHEQYIRVCKAMIDESDTIVQLPGWRNSKGAMMEYEYAMSKGLRIVEWR